MSEALQEAVGRSDVPAGGDHPAQEFDGIVSVGAGAVFHLDVLKAASLQRNASGEAPGANAKKQLSLDLNEAG
ncbi:hypothetical protein [Paraburkholderia sp. CI3]|uniref:hypothetical protein n=1 Tax=Paraburkholderia sp. CI3 TaxID=2991060 RepID=UPI003D23CDCD